MYAVEWWLECLLISSGNMILNYHVVMKQKVRRGTTGHGPCFGVLNIWSFHQTTPFFIMMATLKADLKQILIPKCLAIDELQSNMTHGARFQ